MAIGIRLDADLPSLNPCQSQLFKFIGEKIMWEAIDINNTCSIHKIVEDTLRETSLKQWGFDQFIAIATWKPNKDNKCIQRFIGRMKEKYENKIPDPGERFSYVVVKGTISLAGS